jgi:CRISPR-associated protein Cmr2
VQDFITAARRTHDLWFGSYLLSEISKAAASALQAHGARLIFPAPAAPELLAPGSNLSVANKLLAEAPAGKDPAGLARAARAAAQARWFEFAEQARQTVGDEAIRLDIWREQLDDVIEFYAAWAPVNTDYAAARTRVERLLAGRKALRDFQPAKGRDGVFKSSLDGARESVLRPDIHSRPALCGRLRIKAGEHLDSIGLIKRRAEKGVQFVSVSRVAADAWLRGRLATKDGADALKRIAALCHEDFSAPVGGEQFSGFPRECQMLYQSRLNVMLVEPELEQHRGALKEIAAILREPSLRGEPTPYFAVLRADGDRMGAAISQLATADAHRDLSRQLAEFAAGARDIIAANHGSLIYSGGDDVLAFLPLDTCISAARQLHDSFAAHLRSVAPGATLSVGISIGHCLEPMEDLLNAGREAERYAKQGRTPDGSDERDGLAILFAARGADATRLRAQWSGNPSIGVEPPDQRLAKWIGLLEADQLPDKAAYDLRALAAEYRDWPDGSVWADILRQDAMRLLKKKRSKGRELPADLIESLLLAVATPSDLDRIATELVIARRIVTALDNGLPASSPRKGANK